MARRVAAGAVLAIVLTIAAGACVWTLRVRAVADAIVQQAQLARVLGQARALDDENIVRSLLRPGVRVVLADYTTGGVIDAAGAIIQRRASPAPQGEPPGLGVPEPRADLPPPRDFPDRIAGTLAHVAPVRIETDRATITIAPDVGSLGRWLLGDALGTALAIVALGVGGAARALAALRHERRALETKSEERREAAERYQRFLADTGHELRTPLTIVSGYVDILRAGDGRAQGFDERIVEGLHAETARMRALVGKMLTLARLESPAGVARLLDIAAASRASVDTMRRRYPERTISLVAADAVRIVIDADDFADALGNLVENAIKYAPSVEIAIAASTHAGRATISVSDRGPGIAYDEREKIFERFYRGRRHGEAEGLGLGLAIVKAVAERWGGEAYFESVPGRTVFTLAFPVADEEVHALVR